MNLRIPLLLIVAFSSPAFSQDVDPLSLEQTNAGFDAERSAAVLAKDFQGAWRVGWVEESGEIVRGRAEIASDGGSIKLTLTRPDGPDVYDSIESEAMLFTNPAAPFTGGLTIRFAKAGQTAGGSDSVIADAIPIAIPRDQHGLTFRENTSGAEALVPITWDPADDGTIRVKLQRRDDTERLTGVWMHEEASEFKGGAETSWLRGDPYIDGIIVTEDQASLPYPFQLDTNDTAAENAGTTRTLVIFGNHLPTLDENTKPESPGEELYYFIDPEDEESNRRAIAVATSQTERELFASREKDKLIVSPLGGSTDSELENVFTSAATVKLEKQLKALENEQTLVMQAVLLPGVQPGNKILHIGAHAQIVWPLFFGGEAATLRISRPETQLDRELISRLYPGDLIVVDITFPYEVTLDEIGIRLMKHDADAPNSVRARDMTRLKARRDVMDEKVTYRSDPVYLADGFLDKSLTPTGAFRLPVNNGDVVGAKLFDPAVAFTNPIVAMAPVYGDSGELGELWQSALKKVAKCKSEDFSGDERYALHKSETFTRYVIGDWLLQTAKFVSPAIALIDLAIGHDEPLNYDPSVNALNGDHAAAILIRDEILSILNQPEYGHRIAALTRNYNGEIEALLAAAKENPASDPLLANYSGEWDATWSSHFLERLGRLGSWNNPQAGKVYIPLTLATDTDALAEELSISPDEAKNWAVEQIKVAALHHIKAVGDAKGRAVKAGNCNLPELLVIAGQKSEPAVARVLPRLVKKVAVNAPNAPLGATHWADDRLARGFVQRLHSLGEASRALDAYATIDNAYKAMPIVLASAGAAFALTGVSSTAAVATLLIGDITDAAIFGVEGIENYADSESYYEYALGASHALSDGVLAEADANRQSAIMAGVGAILPLGGGLTNLRRLDEIAALKYYRNIDDGRALVATRQGLLIDELDSLKIAERQQLAAYYAHVVNRVHSGNIDDFVEADWKAFRSFQTEFGNPLGVPRSASNLNNLSAADRKALGGYYDMEGYARANGVELPLARDPLNESGTVAPPGYDPDARVQPDLVPPRTTPLSDAETLVDPPRGGLTKAQAEELDEIHDFLAAYTSPEVQNSVGRTAQRMRDLGVSDFDAMKAASLHGQSVKDGVDAFGFPLKQQEAIVVARGILNHGDAGANISVQQFAKANDLSVAEAQQVLDHVRKIERIPEPVMNRRFRFEDGVSIQPQFVRENPVVATGIANEELAERWARLRDIESEGLGGGIRGSSNRGWRLDASRDMLKNADPQRLSHANDMVLSMTNLGASELNSINHAALFSGGVQAGVDNFGFGTKLQKANNVAHGLILYGQRPVSVSEFARANGISYLEAQIAIDNAGAKIGKPMPKGVLIPMNMR